MTKVTFVEFNGTVREVEATDGSNIMEAAVDNMVPGIDGDCGGECACATCHVHVAPEWADKLPPMGDMENSMLDLTDERDERSRLGCQIQLGPELSGIVVHTPAGQH